MKPIEYANLLDYIKENNSWGIEMYTVIHERNRRAIKYVNATFDSRDGHIFNIKFYSVAGGKESEKSFDCNTETEIKAIYDWLDETI